MVPKRLTARSNVCCALHDSPLTPSRDSALTQDRRLWVSVRGVLEAPDATVPTNLFDALLFDAERYGWPFVTTPASQRAADSPELGSEVAGWMPLEGGEDYRRDGEVRELGWVYAAVGPGRAPVQPLCLLMGLRLREIGPYRLTGLDVVAEVSGSTPPAPLGARLPPPRLDPDVSSHPRCLVEVLASQSCVATGPVSWVGLTDLVAPGGPVVDSRDEEAGLDPWASRSDRIYGATSPEFATPTARVRGSLRLSRWDLFTAAWLAEHTAQALGAHVRRGPGGGQVCVRLHLGGQPSPVGTGGWTP